MSYQNGVLNLVQAANLALQFAGEDQLIKRRLVR